MGTNIDNTNAKVDAIQLEIFGLDSPQTPVVKKRTRKAINLPSTELPLFANKDIEMMATGAPVTSATQAYLKPPDWEKYNEGCLYFSKEFGKGRFIEFFILNNQKQQPEFITEQAESEILERYGVMAARLHVLFAAYAARQEQPWKDPFDLRGTDLIKSLGLHQTHRMNKSAKLKAVADLAWIVGTLGAKIHWYEGELNLCIRHTSPIWTILYVEEFYQPDLFQETGELIEVVIRVMPGAWTEKFLNKQDEQSKKALYQYGFVNSDIFKLNHYKHNLASALALYLVQNRRFHPKGTYRIESLLRGILSQEKIEEVRQKKQYRSRFFKQFYEALEALTEIGFKFKFAPSFPKVLLPAWAELPDEKTNKLDPIETAPLEQTLPKGFFDTWLNSVVIVTAPLKIESAMKVFERKKRKALPPKSPKVPKQSNPTQKLEQVKIIDSQTDIQPEPYPALTGEMVKQMRQSQGWTQAYLASKIGKSVSWVKLVESGRRKINESSQETLREILGF